MPTTIRKIVYACSHELPNLSFQAPQKPSVISRLKRALTFTETIRTPSLELCPYCKREREKKAQREAEQRRPQAPMRQQTIPRRAPARQAPQSQAISNRLRRHNTVAARPPVSLVSPVSLTGSVVPGGESSERVEGEGCDKRLQRDQAPPATRPTDLKELFLQARTPHTSIAPPAEPVSPGLDLRARAARIKEEKAIKEQRTKARCQLVRKEEIAILLTRMAIFTLRVSTERCTTYCIVCIIGWNFTT
ncbi:hypothetical protein BOTCAL_0143g00220 [Botryotinia calthae]|uniref:Uncharacterized protein n=1 Tax=Botryotinia calthae TaxID=38488 RepID=A0A4Y8D5A0_9HELO|nr:hypothetical protein BOTCAL_0143g00220 [Botryotinia calthae]